MDFSLLKKLRNVVFSAMCGMLFFSGCSDDGIGKRYSVTGTVNYAGNPVPNAQITFKPVDDKAKGSRGAYGEVKDGKYTLTTSDPGDGALVGNYLVSIQDIQVDLKAIEGETSEMAKKKKFEMPAGFVDPVMAAKAAKKAKNGVPAKYGSPQTSTLKAEVKAQSNTIDFELVD